jgi:hypothetical protein
MTSKKDETKRITNLTCSKTELIYMEKSADANEEQGETLPTALEGCHIQVSSRIAMNINGNKITIIETRNSAMKINGLVGG